MTLPFDATLEEVLHLVTVKGYSLVYPNVFGEVQGSEIANAMDIAEEVCLLIFLHPIPKELGIRMMIEPVIMHVELRRYFTGHLHHYLVLKDFLVDMKKSVMSGKPAFTPELIQTMDTAVYSILTNPQFALPTILPDGSYRQ